MIYTVELNFSDPALVAEWNAWYESYLRRLVSLPGLETAQRFRAVDAAAQEWEYLAVYSILSLDVFNTDAYRAIGGGGNASKRFHHAIRRRRNVYAGVERMPEVRAPGCVLLSEDALHGSDIPNCLFVPLIAASGPRQAGATALDGTPPRRDVAVTPADAGSTAGRGRIAVYAPITQRFE